MSYRYRWIGSHAKEFIVGKDDDGNDRFEYVEPGGFVILEEKPEGDDATNMLEVGADLSGGASVGANTGADALPVPMDLTPPDLAPNDENENDEEGG